MLALTKQQQKFLVAVIALLVMGWAVKTYRLANPPEKTQTMAR